MADDDAVAVGVGDVGDALAPRLVGGLLDHRAAGGPHGRDDGVAVVGVDPQGDALGGSEIDRRVVAEPEVRRAEVERDERRRTLRRERVDDSAAEQVPVEAERPSRSGVEMIGKLDSITASAYPVSSGSGPRRRRRR